MLARDRDRKVRERVRHEGRWRQFFYGTGTIRVNSPGQSDSLLHGTDEDCEEIVISDLSIGLVVEGDQGLIISILYGGRGGSKGAQYKVGDWLEQKGRTWSAPAVRK